MPHLAGSLEVEAAAGSGTCPAVDSIWPRYSCDLMEAFEQRVSNRYQARTMKRSLSKAVLALTQEALM